MSNLMNRLETRQMPSRDVPICMNLDLLTARDRALRAVFDAAQAQAKEDRMVTSAALKAARAAVADAEAAVRAASVIIRITGVGRDEYNRYLLDCPPRKGHNEQYDPTTFFMHVARNTGTYIDEDGNSHEISPEEWDVIDRDITDGEHDRIATAVLEVNRTAGQNGIDFLGAGSATTPASSATSASRAPSGSRRAASGAGNRKKSTVTK